MPNVPNNWQDGSLAGEFGSLTLYDAINKNIPGSGWLYTGTTNNMGWHYYNFQGNGIYTQVPDSTSANYADPGNTAYALGGRPGGPYDGVYNVNHQWVIEQTAGNKWPNVFGPNAAGSRSYQARSGQNVAGNSAPGGNGGTNMNNDLLQTILALNPPITTLQTRVSTDQTAATAGVAAANTYQAAIAQLYADMQDFLGAESLVGNLALARISSGGGTDLASISLIGLQSQSDSLRTAIRTAMGVATSTLIAAQPAAIGPSLAPVVTSWSTFAANIMGFLGSLGGGLGTGSLGAAFLLAQGSTAFGGQGGMLEALTVGPAITTFQTACTTANTALLAANTLALANTALIPWTTALGTFLGAVSSATVIGGVVQ